MDTELLLTWMSEVGTGNVRGLRDHLAWAMRAHNRGVDSRQTGLWLRDISALGHAEIDWPSDKWAIAPPAAVLLPECGGTAVLAGSRRVGLRDSLQQTDLALFDELPTPNDQAIPVPPSLFVQADTFESLASSLAGIGVRYVGEASVAIAIALPRIELGDMAAPPERGAELEHLDPQDPDVRFVPGLPTDDGLCRFKDLGRYRYIYRRGTAWYRTDHAEGILLDLALRGVSVIRWRKDRESNGRALGRLFVDQGSPLPPLQTRALVLCSGLPTKFSSFARTAIYRNVPREVAKLVAESVHQTVVEDD